MALRLNAAVVVLASLVRLYPKASLAAAFEIGILAAAALRSARARHRVGADTVIDAVALPAPSRRKRKTASRKRRSARSAKATPPAPA